MATLVARQGRSLGYEISFFVNGRRRTIYLSGRRYSAETAGELKKIIESLTYFRDNAIAVPDKRTLAWLESATEEIRQKLVKVGLIDVPESKTAAELWAAFLSTKINIEESTRSTYERAKDWFFMFFDRNEELPDLTTPRMEQWKDFLRTQVPRVRSKTLGLAESTVAGTISKTKAAFNWAKRVGWVDSSPLDGVGRGSFVNLETERFVTMEEYARLLDVCPCQDWRVILALVRIGGLRAPSEVLRLQWSDINWQDPARFYVRSPKTKRYRGKEGRTVPLWDPLREELERLFFAQPERTEFVITRYRDPKRTNLGTQFARIARMAGVGEIQRPFDNMRASRSNEVYASDGAICEAAWIGHSVKTAKEHYLRVQEDDFRRTLEFSRRDSAGKNPDSENSQHRPTEFPALFPTPFHRRESQGVATGK